MPIVHIQVLEGRTIEQKQEAIRRVSIAISESMDVPIDRVRVIVQEVDPQLWGVAGVPLSRSL